VPLQARGRAGGAPGVREGAAPRTAIATSDVGFRSGAPLQLPLEGAYAADVLLPLLVGVTIRLIERPGSLRQIVNMAQLMRDLGQGCGHSAADGMLTRGDHAQDGPRKGLLHRPDQLRQLVLRGGH